MYLLYKKFLLILLAITVNISNVNSGSILEPYSKKAFDVAMSSSDPIVLHFHADWCGICHKQMKILKSLLKNDKYKEIVMLQADFDASTRSLEESELIKRFSVNSRSTILFIKDAKVVYEISNRKNVAAMVDEVSIGDGLDMLIKQTPKQ